MSSNNKLPCYSNPYFYNIEDLSGNYNFSDLIHQTTPEEQETISQHYKSAYTSAHQDNCENDLAS